ncbi:MAG: hypothetical protein R3E91_03685 [Chlamydiales bacterium]
MTKKNDKLLCWNCDGNVSLHLQQCPYCGVNLSHPSENIEEERNPFQNFANPFQSSISTDQGIPPPPFANAFDQESGITDEEWNHSLSEKTHSSEHKEEPTSSTNRRELIALLLLLPGVVFFLFGIVLMIFSSEGVLTLQWRQNFGYFYFFGALPLIFFGWHRLRY